MKTKITIAIVALTLGLAFAFRNDIGSAIGADNSQAVPAKGEKKEKKNKKDKSAESSGLATDVNIVEKWELPEILREISGISYLDKDRFACVQDEDGTIFIYNRTTKKIEKQIPFGDPGDYEGIAIVNKSVFVVRSDGRLYEINDIESSMPAVKEYKTFLTAEHNVEGLCFDKTGNRLLLAMKGNKEGVKGVYAFDLQNKLLAKEAVLNISSESSMTSGNGKKKKQNIMPSAISIHPVSNEIYVNDGPGAQLLILSSKGEKLKLLQLGREFSQPEGITFSPNGELFISNEGTKAAGNILKVELKN